MQSHPIIKYKVDDSHFGQLTKKIFKKIPPMASAHMAASNMYPVNPLSAVRHTGV